MYSISLIQKFLLHVFFYIQDRKYYHCNLFQNYEVVIVKEQQKIKRKQLSDKLLNDIYIF